MESRRAKAPRGDAGRGGAGLVFGIFGKGYSRRLSATRNFPYAYIRPSYPPGRKLDPDRFSFGVKVIYAITL